MQTFVLYETEEEFLQAVRQLAHVYLWRTYHTRDSRGSDEDFPDLVMIRQPRLIFAELKVKNRKPTDGQWSWLEEVAGCQPAEAYVWWPKDWHEIVQCLKLKKSSQWRT